MPSIAGPIKINTVATGGVFHVGDSLNIAPKATSKTFAGSGGFNTGDFLQVNNFWSVTNALDPDVVDTDNIANN
ncbi:spore germination protein [Camelliibacillus cellulosilyticus]|uniref:Spore germination protein n=1 Tax=Camelliibacillus cellulosilyticus TaxID=2174486 RepID=A0ABV9GHJ1_9BACL